MSTPIRSVLFVCTANICRSTYAEVVTRQRLAELAAAQGSHGVDGHAPSDQRLVVASAGTHGALDLPMDPVMAVEAERRGADHAAFRSRKLTKKVIDGADLVLTAEASHRRFVLQERPVAVGRTFSLGQFADALGQLPEDLVGKELLKAVRRVRATARADEDVADPYRRGPEAAAAAAEHLDGLLDRVLPRLLGVSGPAT